MSEAPRERTLTAIIVYKLARAGASVLGALVLLALWAAGITGEAEQFVRNVHAHAATGLSLALSQLALSGLEPRHLAIVIGALWLDASVLFLEGFALLRGWWWAPWLVAVASGVLLPFEVVAIVEHVSLARMLLLAVNLAIVVYLLRRTWLRHRAARS